MDCIINPKSGRAVKKTSVLGKKLMKNPDKTLKEDCIINPKSGRAVRKDSVLGKKILAGMKPLRQKTTNFDDIEARTHSPSREAPPPPKPKTPPKPKKVRKPRVAKPKTPPKPKPPPPPPPQQITEEVEEEIIIPPPPKERTEVPTLVSQEKKRIRTLKQFGPTCWFNSILMNILYSDASRALLLTKYKEWDCDNKIYNTLREILLNKYLKKETDTIEYDDFNDIRPENVLKELYEHDKKRFDFNPDENEGYSSSLYVKKFYELLGVKVIFFDCYIPNADKKNKNPILFVSKYIHSNISWWKPDSKMKGHMNLKDALPRKEIKEMLKEDFEVILIHPLSHEPSPFEYPTQYYVPLSSKYGKMVQQMIKTPEKVNVNKNNFIMDTVNISSVRNEKVSMGHSIAGLTTQGKKVVYNGWTRMYSSEKFATNNSGKAQKIPCEVIPYEWDVKKDEKFRLGLDCNLTFNKDYDPKTDVYLGEAGEEASELQFSFGESSSRILYYVKDVKNLKNIPKAEPEPRPIPPEKSKSKTIFITEDVSATSQNKYSLDKRINLYNKAKIYLDKISEKECITRVKSGSKDLMTLSNMLFMDKKIGTESAYGAIYLSSIKNVRDLLVVSKITESTKDNLTEIIIMEQLTDKLVKTKKTKHFPLLYTSHLCPDKKEKLALVSVNELCNGDLKMLVDNPSYNDMAPETIVNIMYQMLISLTTFNNFGYLHNDTHWGNFLYQNNTEEGYYEYEYKGQLFYIPSCPYNIMLYDFGLSRELKHPNDKITYLEFMRPLSAFQPENISGYVGWNSNAKKRDINELIDKIQEDLMSMAYFAPSDNKKDVFMIIITILKKYFGDMVYKTTLKGSDIILNDKPFKIA